MASMPCVLGRDGRRAFAEHGWEALTSWMHPSPQRFMDEVFEPFLASEHWWLGLHPSSPWEKSNRTQMLSDGACAGVPGATMDHPCHASDGEVQITRGRTPVPRTRVFGVGLMKAGSTAVWQALGAATRLPKGFDCLARSGDLLWEVILRKESLGELLDECSEELFKWEFAKDPSWSLLAGRLAIAWPALASHKEALRIYFLVRSPFAWLQSFIKSLDLTVPSEGGTQQFSVDNLPSPAVFSRHKQLFLSAGHMFGYRYTGYLDAAVQGWVLTVDEYLRCPSRFALLHYEDFLADPSAATERLARDLGLPWSEAAAVRAREAAAFQYQSRHSGRRHATSEYPNVFGPELYARIYIAVSARAALLGYSEQELGPRPAFEPQSPLIDVPEVPDSLNCGP